MTEVFIRLGIALGLGLLVGLQRERTDARLAGFRTFPLVTVFGTLCGLLAEHFGGWVMAGGLGGLALVIVGGNLPLLRAGEERPGVTTEVTMLLMFAVGAYLVVGSTGIAIVICGAIAVLLHLKPELHSLAAKIGDRDFKAIMQFALISLVILPVLPDRAYGPYLVLNPFTIWLMVVLIVGISLGGYLGYKLIGTHAGAWASGLLGGLISSTATTVSLARRSRQAAETPKVAAFVILIASAIVFVRVGILIGMTGPAFLHAATVPLATMFVVLAVFGWRNLQGRDSGQTILPEQANPTELKSALIFGLLYSVVLVAVAAANDFLGARGLYLAAIVSGLTDMDAITLSITQLVNSGQVSASTGWRLVLVAAMANVAFKTGVVAVLGGRLLLGRVAAGFGASAVAGAGLLFFWPD